MTTSETTAASLVAEDGLVALRPELERCRELVRVGLVEAVPRLGPALQPIISYHLGWTDVDGRPAVGDTGKGLRGCLAVLSAELVGGASEVSVPGAVAVELVHNFSLLHDDVIDLDRERRHRPTAWTVFGIGPAIVAGDGLFSLALEVLLGAGGAAQAEAQARAASSLLSASTRMIEGQAMDLSLHVQQDITVGDVLEMSGRKTGALIACSASIGAVLAGADSAVVTALRQFGASLGVAFQAVDDLLGTFGDPSVTGKDVGGDVRRRKLTLPLVTALSHQGAQGEELRAIMNADTDLDPWHVNRATELIEACGGRDLTQQYARDNHDNAVTALESIREVAASEPWQSLHRIAMFSLRRTH